MLGIGGGGGGGGGERGTEELFQGFILAKMLNPR